MKISLRFLLSSSRVLALALAPALIGPASAIGILNDQEQQIATDMIHDSNQKRPFLTLDPTLAKVARDRAADMAKRNYFSHVNPDGVAANYLIEKAGYPLPDWWGNSPTANYVESIAAGYSTPQTAWQAWMNSSEHRTHILGLDPFYAAETSYGIGFYADPSSAYKYYWVIITAPPQPAPKLAITSPAAGARITNPSLAVSGRTSDAAVRSVEVRVENANGVGDYQPASGTATWSASVSGLIPGSNTIRARALDSFGTVLAEATRAVTFVSMGELSVVVSGSGSVTAGFAGTTAREVGKKYTITATPSAGNLFAGWSGGIDAKTPSVTFTMADSLTLTASFIPNPFIATRGAYSGLATSGSTGHNGFLRIAATATGAFTGALNLDGVNYSFVGRFGLDGTALVTLKRAGQSRLALNLQIDLGGEDQIAGTISDGIFTASISTNRAVFDAKKNPAPHAGRYTVVLAANPGATGAETPQGNGFAVLAIGAAGNTRIVGRMGDGTPFSHGSVISKNETLPVYARLYGTKGSVAGMLAIEETAAADLDGTLNWTKPANAKDVFYPLGFAVSVPTVGSLYRAVSGANVLNIAGGNGTLALGHGNLDVPISQTFSISTANKISLPTPGAQKLTLAVNAPSGLISGKFIHPADNKPHAILGVAFQKQNSAFGFFRGIDQAGFMSITTSTQSN